MPKTQTKKTIQKGGDLFNPSTWFKGEDMGSWFSKAKSSTSNFLTSANSAIGRATTNITKGAQSALQSSTDLLNTDIPLTQSQEHPETQQNLSTGGKKKYEKYTLKGGKGMNSLKGGKGLGLTYYATPVSNINIAKPTYWEVYANGTNQYNIKGGSKRKRTKRRNGKTMKKH